MGALVGGAESSPAVALGVGGRVQESVQPLAGLGRNQGGDQAHSVGLGLDGHVAATPGLGMGGFASVGMEFQQQSLDESLQFAQGKAWRLGRDHRFQQRPGWVVGAEVGTVLGGGVQLPGDQGGPGLVETALLEKIHDAG